MTITLYRLYDGGGALLYVGITSNWAKRMRDHASGKIWWSEVASRTFEEHPDRTAALAAERFAIGTEEPRYNQPPGRRSEWMGGAQPPVKGHEHIRGVFDWFPVSCYNPDCQLPKYI